MDHGFSKVVGHSHETAIEILTEELKKEGFGIITSIDMKDTIKQKLNLDMAEYTILGVCNPPFAYQALEIEKEAGLMLPCNVIVYQKDGKTNVTAVNPMMIAGIFGNPAINPVAEEMRTRLERVIAAV